MKLGRILLVLCSFLVAFGAIADPLEKPKIYVAQKCPVSGLGKKEAVPFVSGIITAIAGKFIDQAVSSALQGVGDDKSHVDTAYANVNGFYSHIENSLILNPEMGCIVFVLGTYGDAEVKLPEAMGPFPAHTLNEVSKETFLSDKPSFYFEAVLEEPSTDSPGAFTITPVFLYYGKHRESHFFGSTVRDLALGFEFFAPGKETTPFAKSVLQLPYIKPNEQNAYRQPFFKGISIPWMPLPQTNDTKTDVVPFTVKVTLTETDKPGKLAKTFGKAISGSSDAIADAIKKGLGVSSGQDKPSETAKPKIKP